MTIEEKLRVFYDTTIADATKQSEEIIKEYKLSLEKIYEDHKREVEEKATYTLSAECQKLVQEKNKDLSLQALEYKRLLSEKVESLKKILFDDIQTRLISYMQTEDYTNLLIHQVTEASKYAKQDEITIYINASDADKKEVIEEKTGTSVTISSIDFIGGTRAVIHSKNILIDRSFSSLFEEEKEQFTL
ncbi:MAG: V/A-type H+/Na+-transporting ATPase subunit [Clostridiales bacterium]|nr:V/A-type H+/Na+-transporting ATPase subunit [Clostridiales bacterium]